MINLIDRTCLRHGCDHRLAVSDQAFGRVKERNVAPQCVEHQIGVANLCGKQDFSCPALSDNFRNVPLPDLAKRRASHLFVELEFFGNQPVDLLGKIEQCRLRVLVFDGGEHDLLVREVAGIHGPKHVSRLMNGGQDDGAVLAPRVRRLHKVAICFLKVVDDPSRGNPDMRFLSRRHADHQRLEPQVAVQLSRDTACR